MTDKNEKSAESKPSTEIDTSATQAAPELQSAVSKLAEKKPEKLFEFMAMGMGPAMNPLHQKMTPEHISKVIDLAVKHDERQYDLHKGSQNNGFVERNSTRRYCFAAFIVLTILIIVILMLFRDKPNILIPILSALIGAAGGFGGGWGMGRRHE